MAQQTFAEIKRDPPDSSALTPLLLGSNDAFDGDTHLFVDEDG